MKQIAISLKWIAVLAIVFTHQVRADFIVDTGTPNQTGSPLTLSDGQWLAAKISTNQNWQISSLEGFISADTGNPDSATYTVALYGNGANNRPDTYNELFAQQATFIRDGWNGLQGLNLALDSGTYWLAFEVRASDTLQGLMPVFAPNALQTAFNDTTSNAGYLLTSGSSYNFGVQVSAVPVPPALLLFVSGFFAINLLGKRQSV